MVKRIGHQSLTPKYIEIGLVSTLGKRITSERVARLFFHIRQIISMICDIVVSFS